MKNLFIDCSNGISSDMFLSALIDCGIPRNIFNFESSGLEISGDYSLEFEEGKSYGIRGLRSFVRSGKIEDFPNRWEDIKRLIENSLLSEEVKEKTLMVFETLAKAEATIHGVDINDVQFHEIGYLDSIVDVIAVCISIDFLKPKHISCAIPPSGAGNISTAHGVLPLPAPTVLEIAREFEIPLQMSSSSELGELTTPTGIALLGVFSNSFTRPSSLEITNIGIGLGQNDLGRPNFLRIIEYRGSFNQSYSELTSNSINQETIVCQEAWFDDCSSEDLSLLTEKLREAGAIEVGCQPVNMKKGRNGLSIKAMVSIDNAINLRLVWFSQSTTLGFREWEVHRWFLPRRLGKCVTSLGEINVKQIAYPNGKLKVKPEHDELIRLVSETGRSVEEVRKEILPDLLDFVPSEDW